MPIDGGAKVTGEVVGGTIVKSDPAIALAVIEITTAISWPADWFQIDDEIYVGTRPYAGQPCSDFELFAGESTYKHIQAQTASTTSVFRCVANTEPIYLD